MTERKRGARGAAPEARLEFSRRPSVVAFMLRGLYPSPGLRRPGGYPPIRARWAGHRIDHRRLGEFFRLTGLRADEGVPLLYAHVFGFRLQMVILTHPAFPLPIWGALQIRNHLLQHRPIAHDAVLDLETSVEGHRILEKGAEIDLRTWVSWGKDLVWESRNTFYYRGRFGEAGPPSALARAPEAGDAVAARWRTAAGPGWRVGGLTGDYNGIHWWSRYARLLGFRRAFHHPQLILGQCMARLAAPGSEPVQRLDAWLRGPVYDASDVTLRVRAGRAGVTFAVTPDDETRPAILGHWSSGAQAGESLDDRPLA